MPKLVPKLRFTLTLPLLLVSAGIAVRYWQEHVNIQLPGKREYPFETTATLIYRGFNAPAIWLKTVWGLHLPFYHSNEVQVVLGIPLSVIVFLACVIFLWSSVGILLDRRLFLQPKPVSKSPLYGVLFDVILLIFSKELFGAGFFRVKNHLNSTNPNGALIEGCLYLAWALVFVAYSFQDMLKIILAKRTESPTMPR